MLTTIRDGIKDIINMSEFATGEKEVSDKNRYRATDTLIEMADDLIIRPLIVISEDLEGKPDTENIINLNMDTFANLYLKAYDIATNISGSKAEASLKLLSTRQVLPKNMGAFGIESINDDVKCLQLDQEASGLYDTKGKRPIFIRELELNYKSDDKDVKAMSLNVMIIADVLYVPVSEIKLHSSSNGRDKLFFNRVDDMNAKLISFWSDFIFSQDMVKEYKKGRLKSKSDLGKFITKRQTNSSMKRARGNGGMDEYYTMLILSREVVNELEVGLGGSFNKSKIRDLVFESFKAMSLTRVDTDHEMVLFDLKSKSDISTASMTLKSLSKAGANDAILDIMKFQAGMR